MRPAETARASESSSFFSWAVQSTRTCCRPSLRARTAMRDMTALTVRRRRGRSCASASRQSGQAAPQSRYRPPATARAKRSMMRSSARLQWDLVGLRPSSRERMRILDLMPSRVRRGLNRARARARAHSSVASLSVRNRPRTRPRAHRVTTRFSLGVQSGNPPGPSRTGRARRFLRLGVGLFLTGNSQHLGVIDDAGPFRFTAG